MRTPALFATLLVCSCGPAGPLGSNAADDYGDVFLYLINAYPGASEMKVKQSGGTIAKNVGFGERSGYRGLCPQQSWNCVPALVDRTDGTFDMTFDGERGVVDLTDDIRSMYPQETATMVSTAPDRGLLLRHPQTVSSTCGLNVVNALAVEDISSESARFELAVEVERAPQEAGFEDESNTAFVGPCGALPTDAPEHEQLIAPRVARLEQIRDAAWFVPVVCPHNEPSTCFAWGVPTTDGRSVIGADGRVEAVRDTASYFECVESTFSRVGTCGAEPSWSDVTFDARDVKKCTDSLVVQTRMIPPQAVERFEGQNFCDATFRIRTAGRDLVFGPHGGDQLGSHNHGDLIETTVDISAGSDHFFVLYGRPVNPRTWQWESSETFVDLDAYPYPVSDGSR